jgi:peptidoglycan hydrolase FlgJ
MTHGLSSVEITPLTPGVPNIKLAQMESSARREELYQASREFESYFLSYLMKVMRESIPKGALTANRMGEMFYSFYDEEIGKRAAQAGGIGLSDYVLDSVARNETFGAPAPSDPPSMKS